MYHSDCMGYVILQPDEIPIWSPHDPCIRRISRKTLMIMVKQAPSLAVSVRRSALEGH